jgi:hypothetical protein
MSKSVSSVKNVAVTNITSGPEASLLFLALYSQRLNKHLLHLKQQQSFG